MRHASRPPPVPPTPTPHAKLTATVTPTRTGHRVPLPCRCRPLLDLAAATQPQLQGLPAAQLVQLADGFAHLGLLPGAEWMRLHRCGRGSSFCRAKTAGRSRGRRALGRRNAGALGNAGSEGCTGAGGYGLPHLVRKVPSRQLTDRDRIARRITPQEHTAL